MRRKIVAVLTIADAIATVSVGLGIVALVGLFGVAAFQILGALPWGDLASLSRNQAVIAAAAVTGLVAITSSWVTKSREFRSSRADQMAETSVRFFKVMRAKAQGLELSAFSMAGVSRVAPLRNELQKAHFALLRMQPDRDSSVPEVENIGQHIDHLEQLISHVPLETTWGPLQSSEDEIEALARLQMYSTRFLTLKGRQLVESLQTPRSHGVSVAQAIKACEAFLDEAKLAVAVQRRSWVRRLIYGGRTQLLVAGAQIRDAWAVLLEDFDLRRRGRREAPPAGPAPAEPAP